MSHLNRREWIGTTAIAGLSLTAAASHSMATTMNGRNSQERVRIAIITDVHQDIMHDGEQRMQEFTTAIQKEDVDFAIQLGDFCVPKTENQKFLDLFHDLDMPCKHVLGNHDMDGGFRPEQTVEFYGMPSPYYSFDQGGVHFVVLDGNEAGGKKSGYKRFMGETQQAWLKEDLADTELPTMIFSHQPLNHDSGIENREEIQKILTQANSQQSKNNIIGCFSGHLHLNHLDLLKDIHYAQINSASYLWVGSEFIHESYSKEIHQSHEWIKYTCPYEDVLWAVVDIDLSKRNIEIHGRRTKWVGASPTALEMPAPKWPEPDVRSPVISNRSWAF